MILFCATIDFDMEISLTLPPYQMYVITISIWIQKGQY